MIIGVGLVGSTAITTPATSFFGINKITIKNNDSYFDKIKLLSDILTETEMDAIIKTDELVWTNKTLLLMDFNQNLLGGNIGIDLDDVERAILYRAESDTPDDLTVIDNNIDPDAVEYFDYTALNEKEYIYYLTLVDSDGKTSELFSSNNVTSSYDSFFFIDPVENISFRFNLDASSSQILKNEIFNIYTSAYKKYPITSRGLTNFDKGTINCKLGYLDDDGVYIDTVEYLESLEAVIKNNNTKYIKNRAGNIWAVQSSKFRYLANTTSIQYERSISFDYVEVSGVNGGD